MMLINGNKNTILFLLRFYTSKGYIKVNCEDISNKDLLNYIEFSLQDEEKIVLYFFNNEPILNNIKNIGKDIVILSEEVTSNTIKNISTNCQKILGKFLQSNNFTLPTDINIYYISDSDEVSIYNELKKTSFNSKKEIFDNIIEILKRNNNILISYLNDEYFIEKCIIRGDNIYYIKMILTDLMYNLIYCKSLFNDKKSVSYISSQINLSERQVSKLIDINIPFDIIENKARLLINKYI